MTHKGAESTRDERSPSKVRSFRDALPTTLDGVTEELEYWEGRQGEGEPGSPFEQGVRNRLETLRDRQRRYTEATRNPAVKSSANKRNESGTFHTAFNTYRIVGQPLGSGGAGTVHAVQDADGDQYALKILKSEAGSATTKRFHNEIAFCSKSNHKNIVAVLDYGVAPSLNGAPVPFYVMPLYPTTLRKLMHKGISPSEVLQIFSQILDGVEAAHLKGVWHRDLKPENILCDPGKNEFLVADFGIAKFNEEELHTAVETSDRERLANFLYSAPEQRMRGKEVSYKADIFSLGLILNEMFTAAVPQGSGYKRIGEASADYGYLDNLADLMIQQAPESRIHSVTRVKEELIARGNEFVGLQRLDQLKREVVPASEVSDPLITDPIRLVAKEDYHNGILTLRLNQAVNGKWLACFQNRATRFSANVSSAVVSFRQDRVDIIVSEHFVQEGVRFVKDYLGPANEDYAALVRKERLKELEGARATMRAKVAQAEAKLRLLGKIEI